MVIVIDKNEMIDILKKTVLKMVKIALLIVVPIVIIAAAIKDGLIKDCVTGYGVTDKKYEAQQILANIETVKVSPQYAELKTGIYTDVGLKIASQEGEYEVITNNAIDINIEAKIQEKIQKLEERGIEDTYISEENLYEYIKAFVKAEYITQYPDLRSADKIGTPTASNEFQGCIQIHRALSDGTTQILEYIEKSIFDSYISSNNIKAAEHFTLDSDGNIVIAGWTRVTTNVTSNEPGVENITDEVKYSLTTNSINYKSLVEVYTMPFDLLWTFTVMGDDADFAYNVAKLALNSKIIFTVQDNLTTIVTENIEEFDKQEKNRKEAEITVTIGNEIDHTENQIENSNNEVILEEETIEYTTTSKDIKIESEEPAVSYKTQTIIKTETCTTNIDLTYADTWIVEYKNTYSNTTPNEIVGEPEVEEIEDTQYELVNSTTLASDSEIEQKLLEYKIQLCGSNEIYQEKEGKISGSIGTIYYKTYSRTLNKTITNKTSSSYNKYVQGTPTVIEKTNKNSEEDNFVTLFLDSKSAKSNILSISSWFFEALEQSTKAADMIDIVKYLFYQATNNDYGVKSLGLSIINLKDTKTVKGSSTENFIKAWENSALWKYETQDIAPFPTGYLTTDGLNYIVYEDNVGNGHNNIAYGLATFITDSSNVKVNHPQYGGGYYNYKEIFAAEGIIVEDLYEGALVSKEAADAAFENQILPFFEEEVESYLKDNLPEYEFTRSQKDALIAVAYQRGNIYGFKEAYIASLNEDGNVDPEKIAEKFIVNGEQVFSNIEAVGDRKNANWLLFTQGEYIDRAGNEIVTRINLDNWDGDYYVADQYTFPVYNQYDSRWSKNPFGGLNGLPSVSGNKGKQQTIASSGCGCCSLAAIISGYVGELITPDILTQTLDEEYPTGSYYCPGAGSYHFYFYDNEFLKRFGLSGKSTRSREDALEALKNGYAVIGGETGHILAYVPVSSEDAELGYVFRIIDSARGHNVLCRDFDEADLIVDGNAGVISIIYPYTK